MILGCSLTSTESRPSLTAESAATEAANQKSSAVTSVEDESVVGWELEAFETWRTLSDTESAQIEKAYCDPNNDTAATSIVVCMATYFQHHC